MNLPQNPNSTLPSNCQAPNPVSAEALGEAIRQGLISNLIPTIRYCAPTYKVGKVHRFLANKLETAALSLDLPSDTPALRRIILNMPPRHGKSRLTAVEFACWLMGKRPGTNVAVASYSGALATKHSKEARARVCTAQYQKLFKTTLSPDHRMSDDWGLTNGSNYIAVGVDSAFTGMGADVLVIDDPIANHQDATSETIREHVWQWYLSVAYTRLSPTAIIIVIMTRWHVDDLAGRLTDPARVSELEEFGPSEKFEVVNLPGIAKKGDLLGRQVGEALHPERWPEKTVRARMGVLGSYLASALYDGEPVPQGGNYIDRTNFQIIQAHQLPKGMTFKRFWDLATDDGTMNDYSAGVKAAHGPDIKGQRDDTGRIKQALYIADITFGKWKWPEARQNIINLAVVEKILIGVEAVAGFKTSVQNLREEIGKLSRSDRDIVVHEIGVETDKLTRALPWIAKTENKLVYLVAGEWVTPFLNQASAFPNGKNDDLIDGVSGVDAMLRAGRKILVC